MRPALRGRLTCLLAAGVLVVGASSCGDGGDDEPAIGSTAPPTPATAPDEPPPAAPGTGVIVIDRMLSTFAVTECRLEPDPSEPAGARTLVRLAGAGTTARDVAFTIEARRYSTGTGAVQTFTDTVTYSDPARILQAQRIEVAGQIDDLRDPTATTPLLRPRADGLSGVGLAGPPGGRAEDEGIVGIAVQATC